MDEVPMPLGDDLILLFWKDRPWYKSDVIWSQSLLRPRRAIPPIARHNFADRRADILDVCFRASVAISWGVLGDLGCSSVVVMAPRESVCFDNDGTASAS